MYQQDRDTSWRCLKWKAKSIWVPRGFISVQGELVALQGVKMDFSVLSYVWMQQCFDWWRWSGGWLSPCENPLGRLGLGKNLRTFLKGLKCLLVLLGSNSDSSFLPAPSATSGTFRFCDTQALARWCHFSLPFSWAIACTPWRLLQHFTGLITVCFGVIECLSWWYNIVFCLLSSI